jgi:hypothetical protein
MMGIIFIRMGRMKLNIWLSKLISEIRNMPVCPSLQTYLSVSHPLKRVKTLSSRH